MTSMNQLKLVFGALAMILIMAGCSKTDGKVEAIPCKLKSEKEWSLTAPDGKLIAAAEYSHRPSAMIEDRYWAQNEDGYWQLYSPSGGLMPVVDREFRYVSNFYGGKAMVAERDKPVSIIDRDGNETISLEKLGSYTPSQFSEINDGLAVFAVDTVQGVVNFEGEVVVPAKYYSVNQPSSGRIIAQENASPAFYSSEPADSFPESQMTVFAYAGQALFKISSRKYSRVGYKFMNGYLPVGTHVEDKDNWGLMNAEGELVLAPSPSNRAILEVSATHFIFMDDDGKYGVKAIDGTTVLKAKYTSARFLSDTRIAVSTSDFEEDDAMQWVVMDLEGQKVCGSKFYDISPVMDGRMFVQVKTDRWTVMSADGEIAADAPQYDEVYYEISQPSYTITSDFIDIPKLIEGVGMSAFGVDSLTFQSSARQALERQARYYSFSNQPHPSNYSYTNEVNIFPTVEGEMISETVIFPSNLSHQTFREEKVIDYVWGNYYWYHMNKVPTGYVFTSDRPSKFSVSFNNYGKLRGKLRTLYNDLVKHFSSFGTVEDHNRAATVIDLGNGRKARIALEPNSVSVLWGKLSGSDTSIYSFDGNREELSSMFADEMEEGDV